ncbi:T9SS type A sorting domain-containing protein [bacterium]|nr:T9SS type A sorting domain-containing protein [bacterium]
MLIEDEIEGTGIADNSETVLPSTILPGTDDCVVEVFGNDTSFVYTGGERLRGNIFAVDSTVNLVSHKMFLDIPTSTSIYFVIYESTVQTGPYNIFHQVEITSGTGQSWYSSGPIDVTLLAGNYYLIAACWQGSVTYYCGGSLPVSCSFGSQIYNVQPNDVFPPDSVFSGTLYSNTSYYQTLVTNDGNGPPFIVNITHVSGPPGNLVFDIFVEYLGMIPVNFDAWLASEYQGGNPTTLVMRSFVNFQPGWVINRPGMFFPVPPSWPGGSYTFWIRVGDEPGEIWAEDFFQFTIPGIADGSFSGFLALPDNTPDPFAEIIKGNDGITPEEYKMVSVYPNPFNPTTTICYSLHRAVRVNLTIYNVSGKQVAQLTDGWRQAGTHEVTFDASDLTSGIYFAKLSYKGKSSVQKLMLIN